MTIVGEVLDEGKTLVDATAHEVGTALSMGARFSPLSGLGGNLAGTAANLAGARLVDALGDAGCDRGITGRAINNFLDLPFGLGKTAITSLAGLAGPELSLAASFGIGSYQEMTDSNCGSIIGTQPIATHKTVAQQTQVLLPAIVAGGGGGLTSDDRNILFGIARALGEYMQNALVFCSFNPLFLVNTEFAAYPADNYVAGELEVLRDVKLSDMLPGEDSLTFLRRVVPSWTWDYGENFVSVQGGGHCISGGPSTGLFFEWAVWPWDQFSQLLKPEWYYTPSSGPPPRNVMEDLIFFLDVTSSVPEPG